MIRRQWGHWLSMLGIFTVSISSVIAFSGILGNLVQRPGPMFLTGDGRTLWVYAVVWGLTALAAVVDAVRCRVSYSVPVFIGVMTVWGLSSLGAWAFHMPDSHDQWKTACLYIGVAVFVTGEHLKVTRYEKDIRKLNDQVMSSMTSRVRRVPTDDD